MFEEQANVIRNPTYAIFVWNHRLLESPDKQSFYYSHHYEEPMTFTYKLDSPVLQLNLKTVPMIELGEFMDRLKIAKQQSNLRYRSCNNEQETKTKEGLLEMIENYFENHEQLSVTFWQEIQELKKQPQGGESATMSLQLRTQQSSAADGPHNQLPEQLVAALDWANIVESLIPANSYQPINLQEYATKLKSLYREHHK